MEEYNFINATTEIMKFMSDDLSSFYLDIAKDILYCEEKTSKRRLQIQTVINEVTFTLMRLLNPIIPFTMDEVNKNYPLSYKENVMYYSYPSISHDYDASLLTDYKVMKNLRDKVLSALESARSSGLIGSAQEALVLLNIKDEVAKKEVAKYSIQELNRIFIVSEVKFDENISENPSDLGNIKVEKHSGVKCDRCWNYFDESEIHEEEGVHLCPRCLKALKK